MNETLQAKTKIENFVKKSRILQETMRLPLKGRVTEESKKFFLDKLNLIATLAALMCSLHMSLIELYTLYL